MALDRCTGHHPIGRFATKAGAYSPLRNTCFVTMFASMNCFRRARNERGATLTGYALLMSGLVVISLGAIQAMNTSSDAVLSDTGDAVGNPRLSVEETKTNPVPSPPPWVGARGEGTCSAGYDGCPLGTAIAFDPASYEPPGLSGDIVYGGAAQDVDFTNLHDDSVASVYLETVVQLNGEWQPPQTDPDGSPAPVTVQPGELVCTYIVHASPVTAGMKYDFTIDFQGEVLGTAYNSDFDVDPVFAASGTSFPAANYVEGDDGFNVSANQLDVNDFKGDPPSYDEIRVFVRC